MNIHIPERLQDESKEAYQLRRKASKIERLGISLFWDSAKLGTYDPEFKIPNRFLNTYNKENKMNSTETLIEQGEGYGLGISQEGVGLV